MRWPVCVVLLGLAACPAGGGELDVSGRWHEDWSCEQTCAGAPAETITGGVDMELTQDGTSVTREDDDGTTWEGTLDGNKLTLSTESGEYSEESTFTFDDEATSFTVESTYTAAGDCTGTCTGDGERL